MCPLKKYPDGVGGSVLISSEGVARSSSLAVLQCWGNPEYCVVVVVAVVAAAVVVVVVVAVAVK